jgi:ABC-type polysaccharide/polyol phosphate export permease
VLWYVVSPLVLRGAYTLMLGLIDQGGIVRRVRFPEETIPAGAVTVQLVTFAVVLVLLIPLSLSPRGSRASVSLLLLPVLVAALFCSALGLVLVGRSWR